MPSVAALSASFAALLRVPSPRSRRLVLVPATRVHSSTAGSSRARGGLPRFHAPSLSLSKVSTLAAAADCRPPRRHSAERRVLVPHKHVVGIIVVCVLYAENESRIGLYFEF
jgi:hypothetical protein